MLVHKQASSLPSSPALSLSPYLEGCSQVHTQTAALAYSVTNTILRDAERVRLIDHLVVDHLVYANNQVERPGV